MCSSDGMSIIRAVLSFIILTFDRLTPVTPIRRDPIRQKEIDAAAKALTLYQLEGCPFCVKVRREARRLGLNLAIKDIKREPGAGAELIAGGKQDKVPCLRIDSPTGVQWMYESSAINDYLRERFSEDSRKAS